MAGEGEAMDAQGAMVAEVQAGKAGGLVTQVRVSQSPPRLASARNLRVTFSIMVGMEMPTQCK